MILHSLAQLYDRLSDDPEYEIAPLGYSPQKIGFKVIIKPDGTLFDIQEINDSINSEKYLNVYCPEHKVRAGSKILPQFLCDKAQYMLGFNERLSDFEKTEVRRLSYQSMHCDMNIRDEGYQAFQKFISLWNPDNIHLAGNITLLEKELKKLDKEDPKRVDIGLKITKSEQDLRSAEANVDNFKRWFSLLIKQKSYFGIIEIQGQLPLHDNSIIRDAWKQLCIEDQKNLPKAQCLITGEVLSILNTTHPKIKGFESATSLVGIQKNSSYESYELEQGLTSPISAREGFKYATALSWMLAGKWKSKHRIYIGDTTCAFWTSKPTDFENIFSSLFEDISPSGNQAINQNTLSKLNLALRSIKGGKISDFMKEETDADFFILGMEQPNPGRFSIRFFVRSSISEIMNTLAKHSSDISIIREYTKENSDKPQAEFPLFKQLLNETAMVLSSGKKNYDTIPPILAGSLMRAILQGTNYPESLYTAVLRRIKADRTINYLRACIIKGVLTRNHQLPIPNMLDTEHPEPSYHLGRLFALLEKAQFDALGDLNSGIRDKYYSSASATPASVYPRILRTLPHHLAKLNKPSEIFLEQKIQEVMSHFDEFPNQLNLKQQGIFAIGYYHQRKDLFTKKETTQTTESN